MTITKKTAGYMHCTNRHCSKYDRNENPQKIWLSQEELDAYFPKYEEIPNSYKVRKVRDALKPFPMCPECGQSMAVWSRQTQKNFDKIFHI
jgi:hypothetical protein